MALAPYTPVSTPRLLVRPVSAADLPDLFEVNGDDEVTRFLPYSRWQTAEDASSWLARMLALSTASTSGTSSMSGTSGHAGTGVQLVIVRKSDHKVIGTVLLFKFDEGRLRQRWVAKGQAYDTFIYSRLAQDWHAAAS